MNWRLAPLVTSALFFGLGMVWRSWLQKRRTGTAGNAFFTKKSLWHLTWDLLGLSNPAVFIGQGLVALAAPDSLGPWWLIPQKFALPSHVVGLILALASNALMIMAQLNMGNSWRVGVDENARPGLVTGGFFRFCRNPIYFFTLCWATGFFFLLPTVLSALMWVIFYVGIRVYISREEAYLLKTYGDEFQAYARRTGRLVPWFGRM